jgi:hypothetical protein
MAKYDGKVDMAKVDVDDVPDAAMKYNVCIHIETCKDDF